MKEQHDNTNYDNGINKNDYETKSAIDDALKQKCNDAMEEILFHLGIDIKNPHDTQADMHYLRRIRVFSQNLHYYILRSIIWSLICGILYMLSNELINIK